MPGQPLLYSKKKVNRAGKYLRAFWVDEDDSYDEEQLADAVGILLNYRAAHQYPLTKAAVGLRSSVATAGCRLEVSQRLKRTTTIVDKLARHPNMALATMQDIGGCRAVLANVEELRRVQRRLRWGRRRRVKEVYDYISDPAASGYRGVHVILVYDERLIEVQLRTQLQHEWAVTVERLGGRLGHDLKSGEGPTEVLELLEAVSRAVACEEAGEEVDEQLRAELGTLRTAAAPYLAGDGR